jgi:pimeloyl-ACP methyl ester carboxylesterase
MSDPARRTQPEAARMRIPAGLEQYASTIELPRSHTRLFYYEAGAADSPPVVLVHGLGDEADTWRRVIGPLSRSFRVIAPDLPGFGRSSLPHRRLSPPFLAGVMREMADRLGIRSATWVGSSLGAGVAQLAALKWPALVERLVLVDGDVRARPPLRGALLEMLVPGAGERRYRAFRDDLEAAYDSLRPYYGSLDGLPAAEREFLRTRVRDRVSSDTQRRAYFSAFRSLILWTITSGRRAARLAGSLDSKTFHIWGADDLIVPLRSWNAGRARLAVIPGVGHLPHQEAPNEVVRLIEECAGVDGRI